MRYGIIDHSTFFLFFAWVVPRFDLLELLLSVVGDLLLLLLQLILRALPAVDLETVDLWDVSCLDCLRDEVGVDHQEDVGEGAPEVSAIDVVALLLGHVDFLASRAVDLHSGCADFFAHTNRQGVLALA